jgi:hypothetical protein
MADMPPPGPPSVPEVRTRLREAVQMLGESTAVDPAVRGAMGDLLAELGRALDAPAAPPAEVTRLADGAARLAEALHHRHDRGLLESSRDRLEGLVAQAEARAPFVVGLARSVIEALTDLGI